MRSFGHLLVAGLMVVLTVSVSLVAPGLAVASYTPGLKSGDIAYYTVTGNYGFTQPVTQMRVLDISATNVTASFVSFSPDGRSTSDVFWIDVFSGQSENTTSNFFFAISSGLQISDPIFDGSTLKIGGMGPLVCGGVNRTAVFAQFIRNSQNVAAFWDFNTGALCRYTANDLFGGRSLSLVMANTTLWAPTPPLDPFLIVVGVTSGLGLPLLLLVVFIYMRRRMRRR